jgi:hypothetical protein
MMSASVQEQQQQQQLYRNQVYWVWLSPGTILLVTGGNMLVARSAVAQRWSSEEILVHEGECYTVERNGWLCLRTAKNIKQGSFISVATIAPAPAGNYLRRLIGKLRAFRTKAVVCGSPLSH